MYIVFFRCADSVSRWLPSASLRFVACYLQYYVLTAHIRCAVAAAAVVVVMYWLYSLLVSVARLPTCSIVCVRAIGNVRTHAHTHSAQHLYNRNDNKRESA